MDDIEALTGQVVSVQDAAAADAFAGHIQWGALLRRDLVLVPAPLEQLQNPEIRLEALIASVHDSSCEDVERIRVERVRILDVRDHPELAIAGLALQYPFRRFGAAPTVTAARDGEIRRTIPDIWETMESQGAVPAGIRSGAADRILPFVAELEQQQRRSMIQRQLIGHPDDVFHWVCVWLGLDCRPTEPSFRPNQPPDKP